MMVRPPLSREAFEKFLLWLSPDHDLAIKKHDQIMQKTDKYFLRKGCPESEELASETRERVIRIVNDRDEYPNAEALFYSVADKVWKEYARKPKPEPLPAADLLATPPQETEVKERQAHCLKKCLARLAEAERDFITRYYESRGHNNEARKGLMAEHGPANSLRVKALRIRAKLRGWMDACMDDADQGMEQRQAER